MRLTVVSQTPEEVLVKVEGRIQLSEEAEVLAQEGRRWLAGGCRLVLDLAGLQAIGYAGLEVLQQWAEADQPVVLRHGSDFIQAVLRFHGLTPEEDSQVLQGWHPPGT